MKTRIIALALAALLALSLAACGDTPGPPPDLTGRWVQEGEASSFYQVAEITDDAIRVWWHLSEDDSEYLYWSGSFTPPQDASRSYTWTSANNFKEARRSAWARREDTMSFTYKDGKIGYVVYMGNLRMSMALERAEGST